MSVRVKCVQCKKFFLKQPSQIKITKHNLCSRICNALFITGKTKGSPKKRRQNKILIKKIRNLRYEGYGYRTIFKLIKYKRAQSSIKRYCKDIRSNIKIAIKKGCEYRRKPLNQLRGSNSIRKWLIDKRGYRCEKCKLSRWLKLPIPLETHHKDGNRKNNTERNLKLYCLNCHSQTDDYRNKNHKKYASVAKSKTR